MKEFVNKARASITDCWKKVRESVPSSDGKYSDTISYIKTIPAFVIMNTKRIVPFVSKHLGIILLSCLVLTLLLAVIAQRRQVIVYVRADKYEEALGISKDSQLYYSQLRDKGLIKERGQVNVNMVQFRQPTTTTLAPMVDGDGGGGGGGDNVWDEDVTVTVTQVMDTLKRSKPPNPNLVMEYIKIQPEFEVKPPLKFLSNSTNPCFLTKKSPNHHICLPYYYLAGFPKCGTTDLWQRLQVLPGITHLHGSEGNEKEPHWWTKIRFGSKGGKYKHGGTMLRYYASFFKDINIASPRRQIVGDGSQSTAWDDFELHEKSRVDKMSAALRNAIYNDYQIHAIHLIATYTPEAKFIMLLRDPVDRLYSDYLYFTGEIPFTNTFSDDIKVSKTEFHQKFLIGRHEMLECFKVKDIRRCAYDRDIRVKSAARNMRIQVGMYSVFIHALLQTVPRRNILVLNLVEYSQHRDKVMERVCNFLGLAWSERFVEMLDSFDNANTRREKRKIGDMFPETRKLITEFYRPFNQALALLMDDDSFLFEAKAS